MKLLGVLCLASAVFVCPADTTYLGLYVNGNKIGYASYASVPATLGGKPVTRSDSRTVVDAQMLGSAMSVRMDSTSWVTKTGYPLRMLFDTESGGRSSKIDALFTGRSVSMKIENGGVQSRQTLAIPKGVRVVDDPLTLVLNGSMRAGSTKTFLVLNPTTATLMKNSVLYFGASSTTVHGKKVNATLIRVSDPMSVTDVYVDRKGDVVRVDGPQGMYLLPVSKKVAIAKSKAYDPATDLAETSSIKADKTIENPAELSRLKLKLFSDNVMDIPSDQFQTVTKDGKGWDLDIQPPRLAGATSATIVQASVEKPEWLKPSLDIPSDSAQFKKLAGQIVGTKKDVQSAAIAVQSYVYQNMRPNAGIGVLRDATEVLRTKEGVCRDYAILTVTLLRAASIPARLASGLVNWDGNFYYHAWAEAWDGARWIGIDSTTDRPQLSASHVKLGEGNVDTAFTFTFLEKGRIQVLEATGEKR